MPQQVPINSVSQTHQLDIDNERNIVQSPAYNGESIPTDERSPNVVATEEIVKSDANNGATSPRVSDQSIDSATLPSVDSTSAATGTTNETNAYEHSNNISSVFTSLTSTTTTNTTPMKPPSTKTNGLRNRIIQRPPPLVLDKVSNFYDIEIGRNSIQTTHPHNGSTNNSINKQNNQKISNRVNHKQEISSRDQPCDELRLIERTSATSSSSANQKFWASLNENASRNKALANARAAVNNATYSNQQQINDDIICQNRSSDLVDSADTLGADLVIRHRNTSNNSGIVVTSDHTVSTLSCRKERSKNTATSKSLSDNLQQSLVEQSRQHLSQPQLNSGSLCDHDLSQGSSTRKSQDTLNNSNVLDDGTALSEHGRSIAGGGNLIGVDNVTPPATSFPEPYIIDGAPLSAGSRPRSNNPFLDNEEEGFVSDSRASSQKLQIDSFHKRPASFIAATNADRTRGSDRPSNDDSIGKQPQPESIIKQFDKLDLGEKQEQSSSNSQVTPIGSSKLTEIGPNSGATFADQQLQQQESIYQANNDMYKPTHTSLYHKHHLNQHDAGNSILYESNCNIVKMPQQSISLDSESAILQPPPSATMQLPHWTEAIYELNNAILDTNSVVGGAENGQFIYIAESGDIVLELDRVKVSGYTLVEFNELVESKQLHLLSAVQTKHSYGLTHDLKHYLNQSFPRNSGDKKLQDLIRENIYRRTIPCTTRPPRPGEQDRVDYYFLTKDQFAELTNRGMLLECGVYSGHYYGTLKPLCDLNILSIYQSFPSVGRVPDDVRQAWDANHPAIELLNRRDPKSASLALANPLYENHETIQLHQQSHLYQPLNYSTVENFESDMGHLQRKHEPQQQQLHRQQDSDSNRRPSIVAVDSEALPTGWERVIDKTHGTYYIDHNTRRTQYEKPYEVELTKGAMGFGFTLVEADNGMLLVRSIIQGGPAQLNGLIKPGDILISAVGISFAGLQHTDVARLFSTFAVGDRVRLTFAKSNFVMDDSFIPDEYLFSNGTNGDLAIAYGPNNYMSNLSNMPTTQSPHIVINQEYEFINVILRRGDQGFGFTISDSMAGQKVRKIQNNETCANLRQGDILVSIHDEDITNLKHKDIVERLKKCPAGEDVKLLVKRKKRFRSKTPMAMHTDAAASGEYSLDSTPQRNCKTPSLDGLMLRRSNANQDSREFCNVSRTLFQGQPIPSNGHHSLPPLPPPPPTSNHQSVQCHQQPINVQLGVPPIFSMTGLPASDHQESFAQSPLGNQTYGALNNAQHFAPPANASYNSDARQPTYGTVQHPSQIGPQPYAFRPDSILSADQFARDTGSNSAQASDGAPQLTFNIMEPNDQLYQLDSYSLNDKLVPPARRTNYQVLPVPHSQSLDYHQMPLYSNSEIMAHGYMSPPALGPKPIPFQVATQSSYYQDDYYANGNFAMHQQQHLGGQSLAPMQTSVSYNNPPEEHDDYDYIHVDLERESTESNWGIRLIGGAEVDRAISIGSIVIGGAASKNGQLKSGDEIISINGIDVVGATHQHVVELISTCTHRASLVVRRKRFADACDVVLTRNLNEGFGFVIISMDNCPLIGRIIEGSPADRCKQLHVKDRIIAVNGQYISSNMKHWQIVSMIKLCGSTLRLRIIPVNCYTVELIKNVQSDNFGFSIRGGSEYDGTPLYILRVAPHGLARDLLYVGDQILEINNIPTVGMTHQQAATIIRYSDIVKLKLRRNYETPASLLVDSPRELQKLNPVTAEMCPVNQSATPNNVLGSNPTTQPEVPFPSGVDASEHSNGPSCAMTSEVDSSHSMQPAISSDVSFSRFVPIQELQQSTSLTLNHQQMSTEQQQQRTSLPSYGNQSLPLYAT